MRDNARINLTVPNELYERIEKFKTKNCIPTTATACVMLIAQRLNAIDESEKYLDAFKDPNNPIFALIASNPALLGDPNNR